MHRQPPGERIVQAAGGMVCFVYSCPLGCGVCARVKVIQQPDREVPFQRDSFEGEPALVGLRVGFN